MPTTANAHFILTDTYGLCRLEESFGRFVWRTFGTVVAKRVSRHYESIDAACEGARRLGMA